MKPAIKWLVAVFLGLLLAVALTPREGAAPAGFPRKPISLVVAYSPGGAVDIVARALARHLEPFLGQRVVVRNKPGAGGEIGYRSLAMANNDGYTIGMITAPPILMLDMIRNSGDEKILNFDVLASVQKDPVVLVVGANSEFMTLESLVAATRSRPVPINVAGDGPLSNNQLQLAVLEEALGVKFNFVPFSGSGPSITALLGNQVAAAVPSASSVTSYVNRGDVRALAVFSGARYEFLADVPTIREAAGIDVPDIGAAIRGVVIPKDVDVRTRQVLADAIDALMHDEEFQRYAESIELPLHYMKPTEFSNYLDRLEDQLQNYMPILLESGSGGRQ